MVSVTLAIPPEIKKLMDEHDEINWSGFIRKAIVEKTRKLSWGEEMALKLKDEKELDEWAVNLQRKARKGRYAYLKRKGLM